MTSVYYITHPAFLFAAIGHANSNQESDKVLVCIEKITNYPFMTALLKNGTFTKMIGFTKYVTNLNECNSRDEIESKSTESFRKLLLVKGLSLEEINSFYIGIDVVSDPILHIVSKIKKQLSDIGKFLTSKNEIDEFLNNDCHFPEGYLKKTGLSDIRINTIREYGVHDYSLFTVVITTYLNYDYSQSEIPKNTKPFIILSREQFPIINFNKGKRIYTEATLVLCNSTTINRRSMLCDNSMVLLYQLLIDFFGECEESKAVLKFHPNTSSLQKQSLNQYPCLDDIPIEFFALDESLKISTAISISSTSIQVIKQLRCANTVVFAGLDFLNMYSVMPQLFIIGDIISRIGLHWNLKTSAYEEFVTNYLHYKYNLDFSDSNAGLNILYDFEVTGPISKHDDLTIIISNSRRISSCFGKFQTEGMYFVGFDISHINTSSIHDQYSDGIILIMPEDTEPPQTQKQEYFKYAGISINVHNSIPLKNMPPNNTKAINSFNRRFRDYLIFNSEKTIVLNSDLIVWLTELSHSGIGWAIDRYIDLFKEDDEKIEDVASICFKNINNPNARLFLLSKYGSKVTIQNEYLQQIVQWSLKSTSVYANLSLNSIKRNNKCLSSLNFNSFNDVILNNASNGKLLPTFFTVAYKRNDPRDFPTVSLLIELLKNIGDGTSSYCVASAYAKGCGVPCNLTEAAGWMRRSIQLGIKQAQTGLFDILWRIGTIEAYSEMVSLALPLAKAGDMEMQIRIGGAYRDGRGVKKDLIKASEWMRCAANQNLAGSKIMLFDTLWAINTTDTDLEAFSIAQSLAQIGDRDAASRLAWCYRYGRGTSIDLNQALKWMGVAANKGVRWAPAEIEEIKRLVS